MTGAVALFLDRDGVINVDHGYVGTQDRWEFVPGIFDVCRAACSRHMKIIVVTNQAGIGRGYFSEPDFHALTAWMVDRFLVEGVVITAVYFCPTHPTEGKGAYRVASDDRKPGPGMLLRAAREQGLDLAASLFLGDKESDMQAGRAAGVGKLILLSDDSGPHDTIANVVITQLADAISHLPDGDRS